MFVKCFRQKAFKFTTVGSPAHLGSRQGTDIMFITSGETEAQRGYLAQDALKSKGRAELTEVSQGPVHAFL